VVRLAKYERIQGTPAHDEQFATLRAVLLPLSAWLLAQIGVVILDQIGRLSSFLLWLSGYLLIWLLYRLAHAILTLWLPLGTAHRIARQIIRPVAIIVALIHTSGLLDEFLNLGFTVQTVRITLGAVIGGLIVFLLAIAFSRGTRSYLKNDFLPGAGINESLSALLATLTGYIVLVLGSFAALTVAGFDLTGLTVILGGLSVGIAFGLQDVIANFVSGFILLFERSVSHGDVIGMEDELGVVQDVGIRATILRTIKDVE
jgi:small-conductance mechanosensitive channel